MSNLDDENDKPEVFKAADKAIVPDAISPETGEVHTQRPAEFPRVFCAYDVTVKIAENILLDGGVEFAQLTAGSIVELNRPLRSSGLWSGFHDLRRSIRPCLALLVEAPFELIQRPSASRILKAIKSGVSIFDLLKMSGKRLADVKALGATGKLGQLL